MTSFLSFSRILSLNQDRKELWVAGFDDRQTTGRGSMCRLFLAAPFADLQTFVALCARRMRPQNDRF